MCPPAVGKHGGIIIYKLIMARHTPSVCSSHNNTLTDFLSCIIDFYLSAFFHLHIFISLARTSTSFYNLCISPHIRFPKNASSSIHPLSAPLSSFTLIRVWFISGPPTSTTRPYANMSLRTLYRYLLTLYLLPSCPTSLTFALVTYSGKPPTISFCFKQLYY